MELSCLIKIHKGSMESYDIDSKTPTEVKEDHDLHTRWYLELYDTTTGEYPDLDLSLIFVETKLNKCTTWDEFASLLTDKIIRSYLTSVPKQNENNLIVTHLLNHEDFELSYCNINTPEDRNIRTFRWRMPDLIISRLNQKNTTNFDNCICCINGLVSMPYVYKDELFIRDGAKHMSSTTEQYYPSMALLDFSQLGNIQIVPFSECTGKVLNGNVSHSSASFTDIKVYLPEEYDLNEKTVFPVIAHSLYLPGDITISGNKSFVISPYKLPIRSSLLKLYQHNDTFLDNTDIIKIDMSVESYIRNSIVKTNINTGEELDVYGNFLIIVDNPNVLVEKNKLDNYSDSVFNSKTTDGILFDQSTQSFYDYVKIDYDSTTDVYMTRFSNNYELDIPLNEPIYGMLSWDCVHNEELFNIHKKNLYLLRIYGL